MCVCVYMNMLTCLHECTYKHARTHIYSHKIFILIYAKNICRVHRSSRIINSNGTFADTNPDIQKRSHHIKIIFIIKTTIET